jgi:hypothetical protein
MNRKAQIQNMETIVVIIIISIIMIIALVFVVKSKQGSVKTQTSALDEEKAMEVAIVASNLNELRCSEYNAMMKTCFDYHRLRAFKNVVENEDNKDAFNYYYSLLGNSKIVVQIITKAENVTIYDYGDSAGKSSSPVLIPTIVLDSLTKQSYFAILEVRTFS